MFPLQNFPKRLLVLCQKYRRLRLFSIQIPVQQALLHALRQKRKQDLFQFAGADGAAERRKSHMKPQRHRSVLDPAGAALQHFLAAAADGKQAAFAGTFRLKVVRFHPGGKPPDQKILQRRPSPGLLQQPRRKPGLLRRHFHPQAGGGRKGIPLHMVNPQRIPAEPIAARQRFVRRVASAVDGLQLRPQLCRCLHKSASPSVSPPGPASSCAGGPAVHRLCRFPGRNSPPAPILRQRPLPPVRGTPPPDSG